MLVNVRYWEYNCKIWEGSMCNLTKQAFAKALVTLKLSSCVCEIHCSTIKHILQNKCKGIRFVLTNKSRSYNSAFMGILMNDCDFMPSDYNTTSPPCPLQWQPTTYISQTPQFVTHWQLWLLRNKVRTLGKGLKSLSIWIKLSCRQWAGYCQSTVWNEVQFSSLLPSVLVGKRGPATCSEAGAGNARFLLQLCALIWQLFPVFGVSLTLRNPHFTFPRALSCKAWGAAIGLTTIFCWNKWKACFGFHLGSVL